MGLRDLAVLAAVFGSLPVIPFRPFIGLAVYTWLAFMRPQDLAWSIGSMELSFYVAVAMAVGLILAWGRERYLVPRLQTVLMMLLAVWFLITAQTAVLPELSSKWTEVFLKVILISVLTTGMVSDRWRFRTLIVVIAFSLGLLGFKYGVYATLRGGAQFLAGPGGFMADRNAFALALNMAIPLLVGIGMTERWKPLKIAAYALVPFCMITILGTFSRGGLLTLALVSAALVWRTRRPVLAALVLAVGIGAFFYVSTERLERSFMHRTASILEHESDASAMGRIKAWQTSWRVFQDHPILGVGPRNFTLVYSRYGAADEARVAHSSYFQMLAETGFPGFALFVAVLVVALWRLELLRGRAVERWFSVHAGMMQISLLAFSVGGALLNVAYFDLFYQLVAMGVALEVLAEEGAEESPVPEPVAHGSAWWRQPRPAPPQEAR